jgi:hypothetical protein
VAVTAWGSQLDDSAAPRGYKAGSHGL